MLISKMPLNYFLKYNPIIITAKAMKKVKNHFIISFLDEEISLPRFEISSFLCNFILSMKYYSAILILLLVCCTYNNLHAQEIKYALVSENGCWKIIDTTGKIITDSLFAPGELMTDCVYDGMVAYSLNRKYGFKDLHGKIVVPPVYDYARCFNKGFAVVQVAIRNPFGSHQDHIGRMEEIEYKYGVIDKKGIMVADTIYNYISGMDDSGVVILVRNDSISLMDISGKISFTSFKTNLKLWPAPTFSEGLLPVVVDQNHRNYFYEPFALAKAGFINRSGVLVIDTIYQLVGAVGDNGKDLQRSINKGGMCGTGISIASDNVSKHPWYMKGCYFHFEGGRCLVRKNRNNIVIDSKGDSIFTIQTDVSSIENLNGYFKVDPNKSNELDYLIPDDTNKYLLEKELFGRNGQKIDLPKHSEVENYWYGHFIIRDKNTGLILLTNLDGLPISPKTFKDISQYRDGWAQTDLGLIDSSGNLVLPIQGNGYSGIYIRNGGYVMANLRQKIEDDTHKGILNSKGKWVLPPEYYLIDGPVNGYFICRGQYYNGYKCGFVNEQGVKITPMKYEYIRNFEVGRL